MRTKHIVLAVAIMIAAITQLHAQPFETLTIDTLCYLGKGIAGEAAGAYFMPDGNIIVAWKDAPVIIDKNSGEVLRKFEAVGAGSLRIPELSIDGKYFIASSEVGKKVWDVATGKIIKQLPYGETCLSKDGTRMYCAVTNDSKDPGIIIEYDMNTLERIDRFCNDDFKSGDHIAISPDGQTLAVSVYKPQDNPYDEKTNQVILIDLKDKTKYTVLETLEPTIYSMEFSPDGKNLVFMYNGGNLNNYIYIYSTENKVKKLITLQDLSTLFGIQFLGIGTPLLVDNSTILFAVGTDKNEQTYLLTWNILENRIKNILNYNSIRNLDSRDSTIMLCNQSGVIGLINKKVLPVKDSKLPNEVYLQFSNNQLEFNSDKSFVGQSMVYDTTGKLIANLGTQPFFIGKNIIRINQPLIKGVYILIIKSGTEQISKKFIAE